MIFQCSAAEKSESDEKSFLRFFLLHLFLIHFLRYSRWRAPRSSGTCAPLWLPTRSSSSVSPESGGRDGARQKERGREKAAREGISRRRRRKNHSLCFQHSPARAPPHVPRTHAAAGALSDAHKYVALSGLSGRGSIARPGVCVRCVCWCCDWGAAPSRSGTARGAREGVACSA